MKVFLHRITVTLLHYDFQFLLRNEWDEILYYILYSYIIYNIKVFFIMGGIGSVHLDFTKCNSVTV